MYQIAIAGGTMLTGVRVVLLVESTAIEFVVARDPVERAVVPAAD
jgi:hypothetical protein